MASTINISEIKEGMILASPVVNNFGQTLIPSGATIKASHKNLLKTWNINTITIKGDDGDEEDEISEEIIIMALEKIKKRAKWQPSNETEEDIINIGVIAEAKRIIKSN